MNNKYPSHRIRCTFPTVNRTVIANLVVRRPVETYRRARLLGDGQVDQAFGQSEPQSLAGWCALASWDVGTTCKHKYTNKTHKSAWMVPIIVISRRTTLS